MAHYNLCSLLTLMDSDLGCRALYFIHCLLAELCQGFRITVQCLALERDTQGSLAKYLFDLFQLFCISGNERCTISLTPQLSYY